MGPRFSRKATAITGAAARGWSAIWILSRSLPFSHSILNFRPAPLAQLAALYNQAWRWIRADYNDKTHMFNVFGLRPRQLCIHQPQPRMAADRHGCSGKIILAADTFQQSPRKRRAYVIPGCTHRFRWSRDLNISRGRATKKKACGSSRSGAHGVCPAGNGRHQTWRSRIICPRRLDLPVSPLRSKRSTRHGPVPDLTRRQNVCGV